MKFLVRFTIDAAAVVATMAVVFIALDGLAVFVTGDIHSAKGLVVAAVCALCAAAFSFRAVDRKLEKHGY